MRGISEKLLKPLSGLRTSCIQETKVKQMFVQMVKSLGVGRFLSWSVVDARGQVGSPDFLRQ